MKKIFLKQMLIASLTIAMPAVLLAQDKEKKAEKKNVQEIVITRNGNTEERTVVEITGDKIKVNGKDVADLKDIQVRVNSSKDGAQGFTFRNGRNNFDMSFNDELKSMMSEDNNRAMLGVVTDEDDKGAKLESVTAESAADKAGLKKGDILTKIDGKKIESPDEVTKAIREHKPGDKVSITYLRDGKEQKATAELGKWKGITRNIFSATRPNVHAAPLPPEALGEMDRNFSFNLPRIHGLTAFSGNNPRLGLSVQDTDDGKGVKVLDVEEDGNAAKAGLKEDDIITQVDDKVVNSADDIASIVKQKKEQNTMQFHIIRSGKAQTIEVKVPRKIKTVDL